MSVERRNNNTVVTITGESAGTSTVTVTVADEHGASTAKSFSVTVKPSCDLSSIGNQTIFKGDSRTLSLSSACNGTYSASSSDTSKVTVSVDNARDELTITGVAVGTATVTVRVTKSGYKDDSETFTVTVTPISPPPDPRADLTASSTTLDADGCTDLSWTTTNANSASINHNVGTVTPTPGGTIKVCPGEEKEYTLTANGDSRAENPTAEDSVIVKPSCDLSSIGNQTIIINRSEMISLSSACNGTYSASSSNTSVKVSVSGSTLMIRGVAVTTSPHPTVTVRVTKTGYKPDSETITVTVTDPPPPPEADLTASSTTLDADGCTILTWETENAESASISPGIGVTVEPNVRASKKVCPGAEQKYTLTANGHPDAIPRTDTDSVTVKPSCDLSSIGNQTIFKGDSKMLSLSSACNGTYSASSSDTSVTVSVNNSTDKLTITGVAVGTATVTVRVTKSGYKDDSVQFTVTVKLPPSPTATLTADSATITEGNCTDLRWTTTNANSASINQGIGAVTPTAGGSKEVCPDLTTIYTLTANGDSEASPSQATASVTVTVNPPTPSSPSITSISPSLQRPDDRVTISGNHFGGTAGSVSFGGHSVSIFSGPGYSWSNTSIGLLIPGSLSAGQVSVTVTTHGGSTSDSYSYTVTGSPVNRGDCDEEDEDCSEEKEKEDEESGDSGEGETDEDPADGGG